MLSALNIPGTYATKNFKDHVGVLYIIFTVHI